MHSHFSPSYFIFSISGRFVRWPFFPPRFQPVKLCADEENVNEIEANASHCGAPCAPDNRLCRDILLAISFNHLALTDSKKRFGFT